MEYPTPATRFSLSPHLQLTRPFPHPLAPVTGFVVAAFAYDAAEVDEVAALDAPTVLGLAVTTVALPALATAGGLPACPSDKLSRLSISDSLS